MRVDQADHLGATAAAEVDDEVRQKCGTPMELDDFAESYFAFLLR